MKNRLPPTLLYIYSRARLSRSASAIWCCGSMSLSVFPFPGGTSMLRAVYGRSSTRNDDGTEKSWQSVCVYVGGKRTRVCAHSTCVTNHDSRKIDLEKLGRYDERRRHRKRNGLRVVRHERSGCRHCGRRHCGRRHCRRRHCRRRHCRRRRRRIRRRAGWRTGTCVAERVTRRAGGGVGGCGDMIALMMAFQSSVGAS